MPKARKLTIAVICRGQDGDAVLNKLAEEVGEEIAKAGATLICGGLGGLMTAAAKGAKSAGGDTIGVLMSYDKADANEYIDTVIATGMGYARNVIVVASADAVIAIDGGPGTLAEIAFAVTLGKPIVGLFTWDCSSPYYGELRITEARDAREAVQKALELALGNDE